MKTKADLELRELKKQLTKSQQNEREYRKVLILIENELQTILTGTLPDQLRTQIETLAANARYKFNMEPSPRKPKPL